MKSKRKLVSLIGISLLIVLDVFLPACATQSPNVVSSGGRRTEQQGAIAQNTEKSPIPMTYADDLAQFGGW